MVSPRSVGTVFPTLRAALRPVVTMLEIVLQICGPIANFLVYLALRDCASMFGLLPPAYINANKRLDCKVDTANFGT